LNYLIFGGSGIIASQLISSTKSEDLAVGDRLIALDTVMPGQKGIAGKVERVDNDEYIRYDVRLPGKIDALDLTLDASLCTDSIRNPASRTKDSDPLRVAQVIGNVSKGGVEAVVTSYYRAMDKGRIQFDYVIHEDSPARLPDDILDMGCRVHMVPSYKHLPSYIKSLESVFRDGKYEVVHSHMNAMSVFSLYAAKRAGVPVRIAHSHSTAGNGEPIRNLAKNALRPFSKMYATDLFACSEHAGRWLFGHSAFDAGKVKIIRNAIDSRKFKFDEAIRSRVRRDLGLEGKLVIGHVGRFTLQKNHMFLLDVFFEVKKRNDKSVLILIGGGNLLNEIKERARKLGLEDSSQFLLMREDVNDLYQAMDVFILPSCYEGLGLVGVEAQCAGLPCLFSSNVPKEVNSGGNVTFLDLKIGAKIWSEYVLKLSENHNRQSVSSAFMKSWDLEFCVDYLLDYYIRNPRRELENR
jgi:glycosyltransferase EpsF